MPCFLSIRIISNNLLTSCVIKEDVGSSNTMTFELYEIALAISHICLCDTDILRIGVSKFTVMPSFLKSSDDFFFIRSSSTMPNEFVG